MLLIYVLKIRLLPVLVFDNIIIQNLHKKKLQKNDKTSTMKFERCG